MYNRKSSIVNRQSPLRRNAPLSRYTPLKAKKDIRRRGGGLKRSWLKPYRKDSTLAARDKQFEYEIKERANFTCEVRDPSGCCPGLHASHIISRRYKSTRHDLRNGVAACPRCHDHRKITEWLKRTDPKRYEWIMEQKRTVHRKTG